MSPIYQPGKLVLQKQFTQQSYMWEFPAQYGLWSPANITTALWLDAADASTVTTVSGAVSQWNDKSGNARHATQAVSGNRPSYSATEFNSLPGVTFDGSDDHLSHGLNTGGPFSLIAVYKVNSSQTSFRGVMAVGDLNTGNLLLARGASAFIGSYGSNDIASTFAYSNGQSVLAIVEDDNSNALKSFWINGTQSGTFTDNPSGQLTAHIGGHTGQYSAITVAECIAVPSIPSSTIRQKIEGYLAHKWGLAASLPSDHPYKTVGPTP